MISPEDLLYWRKQHGLTQIQLADLLLVTVLTIKRWESGAHQPPPFLRLALERLEALFEAEATDTERLEAAAH